MSVVTAGPNNFASEWADGINYGLIAKRGSDGEITHYKPSADTDVARGSALATAIGAMTNGDTLTIGTGVYDVDSTELLISGVSNAAIVGLGRPVIKRRLIHSVVVVPSGIEIDDTCLNFNISGITLHTSFLDADYVTNNAYSLVHNGSGVIESCNIYLYSTVVTINGGNSFKTFVHVDDNAMTVKNCSILSFNTVSAMEGQFFSMALHATSGDPGAEYISFLNTNFLNQNVDEDFSVGTATAYSSCSSNVGFTPQMRRLNLYEAQGIVDDAFSAQLDSSFYYARLRGDESGEFSTSYKLLGSGGSGTDVELFRVNLRAADVTAKAYTIEVFDDKNAYWKAYVRVSTVTTIAGSLTSGFINYTFSSASGTDIFSVTRTGNNETAGLKVIFKPCDNLASDGTTRMTCGIDFSTVFEV